MILRTTVTHATFRRAFKLPDVRDAYPPGIYVVETEEERLETLSFVAFRRVATRLHLTKSGVLEVLPIDPRHLADALARDAGAETAGE